MTLATHTRRLCAPLILCSLAAACRGTGGDDTGKTSTETTPSGTDTGATGDTATTPSSTDTGATGDTAASVPYVLSTVPVDLDTDVGLRDRVAVAFSEEMNPDTLDVSSYQVISASGAAPGEMVYNNAVLTFWPTDNLEPQTLYTVTVTAQAESALGVPMAEDVIWSFTTGDAPLPALAVNLGTAGDFVIVAQTAISTVPASAITGDIGISPAAASYITGFSLTADASNVFASSPQVVGQVFAADYAVPAPAKMTAAVSDMQTAFTDAASRAPDVTELGAGDVSGLTLIPGVYKWGTGLLIASDLTLQGSATDVWIFEIAQGLTVSSGVNVVLAGGAVPSNVFWQVSGQVNLDTTAHLEGIIMSQTLIELRTGASVNGRLLAQTAVVLDANIVVEPAL
jgi:hypothetical protein